MTAPQVDLFTAKRLGETFEYRLDGKRLKTAQARVLQLMLDGRWHTVEELRSPDVGGSSGDRRLRALRAPECGSLTIERRREPGEPGSGVWQYRIDPATTSDQLGRARAYLRDHSEDH